MWPQLLIPSAVVAVVPGVDTLYIDLIDVAQFITFHRI
jgi:hypothetical protein